MLPLCPLARPHGDRFSGVAGHGQAPASCGALELSTRMELPDKKKQEAFTAPRGVGGDLLGECLPQGRLRQPCLGQNVMFARSSIARGVLMLLTLPVVPKLAD